MKFVHLNEYKQTDVIAEFFPEKGFGGTPQKLGRGNYQVKQMCEKPAAVKLCNEFASVVFYENADQTGKRALVNNDCANLAEALTFEPAVITVTLHAQGIKDGKRVATVLFGTYETKVFADYDKVIVPEGMYIVFYGNDADKNALRRYTNESFTVDADLAAYPRAA